MTFAGEQERLSDALRWAVENSGDPAMAAADWLVRDVDPSYDSALDMLCSPSVTLDTLTEAKSVFKTMRVVGETVADRRLGGKLYAATIAVALAYHTARITRQSDAALRRAFRSLECDHDLPETLRTAATLAICYLDGRSGQRADSGA